MTDKKPRKNKGKQEVAWEMKQKQDAARKRGFVGEVFFPVLQKHTKSIHQAKTVCKILQNDIMSTFNMGMKNNVSTLELAKKMEENTTEAGDAYRELVGIFNDLPITEALEIIGGMPEAIEGGLSVEEFGRSLADMEFVDGTMKIKPTDALGDALIAAECDDMRQMGDGKWMAYSKKSGPDQVGYRAQGDTPLQAVLALKEIVHAAA